MSEAEARSSVRITGVRGANVHGPNPVIRFRSPGGDAPVPRPGATALIWAVGAVPSYLGHPPLDGTDLMPAGDTVPADAVVAALAVQVQRRMGHGMHRCGLIGQSGGATFAWVECVDPAVGADAVRQAVPLAGALAAGRPADTLAADAAGWIDTALEREKGRANWAGGWVFTRGIQRLGLPWRPAPDGYSFFEVGLGARSRRYRGSSIDSESHTSNRIQQDKRLTSRLLRDAGISVPEQRTVASAEEARTAAAEIGYPVVVKPLSGANQQGVVVDIRSEEALSDAIARHHADGGPFLLERHVPGEDYRFVTVEGRIFYAQRRNRVAVTGDGRSSITALVERINADPTRGTGGRYRLTRIDLAKVAQQSSAPYSLEGLTLDSVPAAGQRVVLTWFGGATSGGTPEDISDEVHPDYHRIVARVHATIPMATSGIDMLCTDISAPAAPGNYAINEVNARPALMNMMRLDAEPGRMVADFVAATVGTAEDLRVPVVVVATEAGTPSLLPAISAALSQEGRRVASAGRDGYAIDGWQLAAGAHDTLAGLARACSDREADVILVERTVGDLVDRGLGLGEVDIVVFAPAEGRERARGWRHAGFLLEAARLGTVHLDILIDEPGREHARRRLVWSVDGGPPSAVRKRADELVMPGGAGAAPLCTPLPDGTPRPLAVPDALLGADPRSLLCAAAVRDLIDGG